MSLMADDRVHDWDRAELTFVEDLPRHSRSEDRREKPAATISLILQCSALLLFLDCVINLRSFSALYRLIRGQPTSPMSNSAPPSCEELCRAVDFACVFYFKQVLCLQRSAATTLLLRRRGLPAEMVIGAQMLPFQSHAWVEVEGTVVNDKPYMREIYQVLERC
jgi:hypothetical protein